MIEKIIEALIEEGIIKKKDVDQIKKSGKDISEYLIEKGFFGEKSYCEWFSRVFGFDILDDSEKPDESLVKIIPKNIILEHNILPVSYSDGKLVIASPNPFSVPLKIIQDFYGNVKVEVKICSPFRIKEVVEEIFSDGGNGGIEEVVEYIIKSAVEVGATDIHIFPSEKPSVKFRVKGYLQRFMELSPLSLKLLVNRIKIMADLDIAEKRLPQDGRFSLMNYDIRVSVIPTSDGEKLNLRLLKRDFGFSLETIGLSEGQIKLVREIVKKRSGFIFVAGPTGQGKTTTIYSLLKEIDREELNVISIEDPIEYRLSGVSQIQVNEEIGLDFAKVLRHILRQDPDVIFVGEIRDLETADIALKSALTGHLVLTTLHAKDVASGILRLVNLGVLPDLILSTALLGISQRLIRIVCEVCKGDGCRNCGFTGISKVEGVFELVPFSQKIVSKLREALRTGFSTEQELKEIFRSEGIPLLYDELMRKAKEGKIKEEDIYSIL